MIDQKLLENYILLAKKHDFKAIKFLFNHFEKDIFCFANSLVRNHAQAGDICQETFMIAFRKISELKEPKAFKSWLFRICRYQCSDYFKSKKHKYENLNLIESSLGFDNQKDDELKNLVKTIIEKLDQVDRESLCLIDMEGFSYEEGAQISSVPLNTFKTRVFRARKRFIEEFRVLGVDITGLYIISKNQADDEDVA